MSDWKNPSFPSDRSSGRKVEWKAPVVEDNTTASVAMGIGIIIKALIGFLLISSVNALALMLVSLILDFDLTYRNALSVGALYVFWRAYDTFTFGRLLKDR
jgi:hypothetical protein